MHHCRPQGSANIPTWSPSVPGVPRREGSAGSQTVPSTGPVGSGSAEVAERGGSATSMAGLVCLEQANGNDRGRRTGRYRGDLVPERHARIGHPGGEHPRHGRPLGRVHQTVEHQADDAPRRDERVRPLSIMKKAKKPGGCGHRADEIGWPPAESVTQPPGRRVLGEAQAHDGENASWITLYRLDGADAAGGRSFGLPLGLDEDRRVGDVGADVVADQYDDRGQPKCDAPTPAEECGVGENAGHGRAAGSHLHAFPRGAPACGQRAQKPRLAGFRPPGATVVPMGTHATRVGNGSGEKAFRASLRVMTPVPLRVGPDTDGLRHGHGCIPIDSSGVTAATLVTIVT